MNVTSGFRVGLCNAWWFVGYYLAHPLVLMALDRDWDKKMDSDDETGSEVLDAVMVGSIFAAAAWSIGVPLRRGKWQFAVGMPMAAVGLKLFTIAMVNVAHTPLGQPFTTGLYRYSRHPMAVFGALGLTGAAVAGGSRLLLLLVGISQAVYFAGLEAEERHCLARYGDAYRAYRDRTPKYLGLPRRRPT